LNIGDNILSAKLHIR